MMASLDHSMWFHDDFRADEWLLYDSNNHINLLVETIKSGRQRGFAYGKIWSNDGRLVQTFNKVVTTAQEGVIRVDAKL